MTPRGIMRPIMGSLFALFVLVFSHALFGQAVNATLLGTVTDATGASHQAATTAFLIFSPARDLGPRIARQLLPISGKCNSDWGYALVSVIAPDLGGCAGGLFCKTLGIL